MKIFKFTLVVVGFSVLFICVGSCTTSDEQLSPGETEIDSIEISPDSDSMEVENADVQITPMSPIGTPYKTGVSHFQVGDVIQAGDFTMSLLGWNTSSTDGKGFKADPGNVFVLIDFVLINRGNQLLDINEFSMKLLDEHGEKYRKHPSSYFDRSFNPNEQVRGIIPIEVPESLRNLQFIYQPVVKEAEVEIVVDLGPEPISFDLPDELQIPEMQAYSIGEDISYSDVEVTVLGWRLSQGNENDKPAEGTKLIVVDLLIMNKGNERFRYVPSRCIYLRDENLTRYKHDSRFWHSPNVTSNTYLDPNEPLRIDVVFQVPEDLYEFYVLYDDDDVEDGIAEIYVYLPSEPVSMEIPKDTGAFSDENYTIGREIELGDLSIMVLGWSKSHDMGSFWQPEEGNEFVIVDVFMVNHGEIITVPHRHMKLYDEELHEFRGDIEPGYPFWPMLFNDISHGERIRGKIVFEVPEDSDDFTFWVGLPPDDKDHITIRLGEEPAVFEPPSRLVAPNPDTYQVGEAIKIGDLELLVHLLEDPILNFYVETEDVSEFLVVEVIIKNFGNETGQSINGNYEPQIRDENGFRITIDYFHYLLDQPDYYALLDPIATGEQANAFLIYHVPLNSKGFVFLFNPGWIVEDYSGDGVLIDLAD